MSLNVCLYSTNICDFFDLHKSQSSSQEDGKKKECEKAKLIIILYTSR